MFVSCPGRKRGNPGKLSSGLLFQEVRATQQDLSDLDDLVLLFHGGGKTVTSVLLLAGRTRHSHFNWKKKAPLVLIEGKTSVEANVNCAPVTTEKEVYLDSG